MGFTIVGGWEIRRDASMGGAPALAGHNTACMRAVACWREGYVTFVVKRKSSHELLRSRSVLVAEVLPKG